jgi:hypothetical protein
MRRARQHENYDPVILSRNRAREDMGEATRRASYQHDRFQECEPIVEPDPVFEPEPAFEPDPTPVAFQESATMGASHAAEVISLDAMRSVAPTYQAEDLDVPAFLRKRSEVM